RLRAGEGQLAVVDEVGDVEAVVVEHPPHVGHRLRRGQVPGDADAREGVADDQVAAAGVQAPQAEPAVLRADLDAGPWAQSEPVAVEADDTAVDLGDEAARAGAGRREVAGKG